jgi:endonuclease G
MKNLILSIILLLSFTGSAQLLPQVINDNNQIIKHDGYTISYNEEHEQPNWVYYVMKPSDLVGEDKASRKNFKQDTMVSTGSASVNDYKGSGYDRGHLKPAADEAYDQAQMDESFLMSNVSPQVAGFNRGVWLRLENYVRTVTMESDSIIVITGGVLTEGLPTIGESQVSVPKYFYKIIFIYSEGKMVTQAFIIPNKKSTEDLSRFLVNLIVFRNFTNLWF